MAWKLVLGNKRYSSWSLRASLVVAWAGVQVEEVVLPLDRPGFRDAIAAYGAAGLVPLLIDGETTIWDSLAIAEYVAERRPEAQLWPQDARGRARARSVAAEMHSGFPALRREMPMDLATQHPGLAFSAQALADVERIRRIWSESREAHAHEGDHLFGARSIADAMFAPVVTRLDTYGIPAESEVEDAYRRTILMDRALCAWREAAAKEPWVIELTMGRSADEALPR